MGGTCISTWRHTSPSTTRTGRRRLTTGRGSGRLTVIQTVNSPLSIHCCKCAVLTTAMLYKGFQNWPLSDRLYLWAAVGHLGEVSTMRRSEERRVGKECRYRW